MIDVGLYITYAMFFIAGFAAIGFALFFLITNIKKAKSTIIGVLALVTIFVVSYLLSSNETYAAFKIGSDTSKMIGGALIAFYVMFLGAALVAVASEVMKIFK